MNSRVLPTDTWPLLGRQRGMGAGPGGGGRDPDAVDLRALLRVFWRRRGTILGVAVGLGLLTWFAVSQMTPTYEATAKLLLDPRDLQIAPGEQVVSDLDPSEQVVNSEIAVLRSNLLIAEAIERIGAERLADLDPANQPPGLGDRVKDRLKALLRGGSADDAAAERPGLLSPEEQRMQRLIWAVRRDLSVYSERDSYVIGIRMTKTDPAMAMVLANALAETYIDGQLDSRRAAVGQATDWLEARLEELRREVEQAEEAVATYRAESLVTDGGTMENATQQLASLNSQLIEARAARVEAEARFDQLSTVIAQQGREAGAQIVTSPVMETLRAQALDLRQKDAVWARSYQPDHPRRVEIREELDQIEADIARELDKVLQTRRSELEIARIRESSLQESIGGTEERVMSITRNQLGLRQLEREAAAARQTYETLLARMTETRTQKQLQQPDAKMIERATVPGAPAAPRPKLMAAMAAALGGMGAVAFIFFGEMTAQTFRSARELESETGLPVLASISAQPWRDTRRGIEALRKAPYGPYGERIRQLRTAVLMADGHEESRAVLMISSAPGEGKTTTTVALAEMAALAGKRVLVVDGDLRRSTLQKTFAWPLKPDFADFITGEAALSDVIHSPEGHGFDVLAAKGPRADAAEELAASWLVPVIAELKRVYDLVLIDAPALLAVSDALILAQAVDQRLYLVGWNDTPRAAVEQGLKRLAENRLPVSGLILNKVEAARSPDPYADGYSYDA